MFMYRQECATIASAMTSKMDGPTALTFVADFGIIVNTPELTPLREALFEVMREQLRSITQYPWADLQGVPGMPQELLLAIQPPNSKTPLIPDHMFQWLWPFLREHMMVNWSPSLAVTMHHFIQTPAEASEHWDILLTASVEAEIIATVLRETWTDEQDVEVDPEIVNDSIDNLKIWGIRTLQESTNYGNIKNVMKFNPFLYERTDEVSTANTLV
jgi:hypothetical protein